jgi:hypothetical protein
MNIDKLVAAIKCQKANFRVGHHDGRVYLASMYCAVIAPQEVLTEVLARTAHLLNEDGTSHDYARFADFKDSVDRHIAGATRAVKITPWVYVGPPLRPSRVFALPRARLHVNERNLAPFADDLEYAQLRGSTPRKALVIMMPAYTAVVMPCFYPWGVGPPPSLSGAGGRKR